MDIIKNLKSLGFNEKQARVYFALLQLGRATAYQIANKSNLKRPTVYIILEELRIKDAILKIPHAKKQLFIAKDTEELIRNLKNKIYSLLEVLPEIKALAAGDSKPKILFFEGFEEIKKILFYKLDKLKRKELCGFYAYDDKLPKKLIDLFREYNDYLLDNQIQVKGFAPDHPSLKKFRKEDRDYRRNMKIVPFSEYSSAISIDITDEYVRIVAFKDLQGVIIENKLVAECMKQIFNMLWHAKQH